MSWPIRFQIYARKDYNFVEKIQEKLKLRYWSIRLLVPAEQNVGTVQKTKQKYMHLEITRARGDEKRHRSVLLLQSVEIEAAFSRSTQEEKKWQARIRTASSDRPINSLIVGVVGADIAVYKYLRTPPSTFCLLTADRLLEVSRPVDVPRALLRCSRARALYATRVLPPGLEFCHQLGENDGDLQGAGDLYGIHGRRRRVPHGRECKPC